jgi:hypothetical protein
MAEDRKRDIVGGLMSFAVEAIFVVILALIAAVLAVVAVVLVG